MSRFLAILGFFALAGTIHSAEPPETGKTPKGFEPVDKAAREIMELLRCKAMTVAVSRNGVVLYSRGFGWRDDENQKPTEPDTLLRVASVTKPMTAAAIKSLIRSKKLKADDKAFEYLKLEPPAGAKSDERLARITIQHLLDHKGGWDSTKRADPMFRALDAEKALMLERPATPTDMVRWMLGEPLQFDPGAREVYCNFGYCVLGRVIEKASGKSYGDSMSELVFKPAGMKDARAGRNKPADRDPREVWYPTTDMNVEVMDSHGGIVASAPAVCQFLHKHWLSGDLRTVKGVYDAAFFGGMPGTSSMARQRPDGFNVVMLCNNRREQGIADNDEIKKRFDAAIDQLPGAKK